MDRKRKEIKKYKTNDKIKEKKKVILLSIIVVVILAIIFTMFFGKNDYKNIKFGNNIGNKSIEDVEKYILNINSYKAEIEVEINSNKNNNKYVLKQKFLSPNVTKQEVIEPSNIKGLEIIYDGKDLIINNTSLGLSSIYENYEYITDNCLWLQSFIEDYKSSDERSIKQENNEIVMETKIRGNNKYMAYKKLYIDSNTYKPKRIIVQNINKKNLVYISYKEIEIDCLNKDEVLAFNYYYSDLKKDI